MFENARDGQQGIVAFRPGSRLPVTLARLNPSLPGAQFSGGDRLVYALQADGVLWSIDALSGSSTRIGQVGAPVGPIAYDSASTLLYVFGGTTLSRVVPATGLVHCYRDFWTWDRFAEFLAGRDLGGAPGGLLAHGRERLLGQVVGLATKAVIDGSIPSMVVHNSVRYPWSMAPWVTSLTSCFFCFKVSRGGRPGAGFAFNASCPPERKALRQRITLLAWQPKRRAIS